jgi:hypothetical protein
MSWVSARLGSGAARYSTSWGRRETGACGTSVCSPTGGGPDALLRGVCWLEALLRGVCWLEALLRGVCWLEALLRGVCWLEALLRCCCASWAARLTGGCGGGVPGWRGGNGETRAGGCVGRC